MLRQEGYGGAYTMVEVADESIIHYAEHATAADIKVSNLEICISQLEIGGPPMLAPQQQQMLYYMPEAAYLTPAPATMPVPSPKTVQFPQPPQQWVGYKTQQGYHPNKRQQKINSDGDYCDNHQQTSWGQSPNTHYQHPSGNQGGQHGDAETA